MTKSKEKYILVIEYEFKDADEAMFAMNFVNRYSSVLPFGEMRPPTGKVLSVHPKTIQEAEADLTSNIEYSIAGAILLRAMKDYGGYFKLPLLQALDFHDGKFRIQRYFEPRDEKLFESPLDAIKVYFMK